MRTVASLLIAMIGAGLGMLLALAVHEIGHLVAGRLGGLRPALLIVGPLQVQMHDRGVRFSLNTSLGAAGGIASSVPWREGTLRRSYALMSLGGPLASLILGVAAIAGFGALGLEFGAGAARRHALWYSGVSIGWLIFAAASVGIGILTLIPLRYGGLTQDGRRFLVLSKPGRDADRQAAVMALGAWTAAARRPREWDPAIVAQATSLADGTFDDILGHYQAYFHALDAGDVAAAHAHVRYLAAHLDATPKPFQPVISAEVAYFLAAYEGDGAAARTVAGALDRGPLLDKYTLHRTEAAVMIANGDTERGLAAVRDAIRELERSRGAPLAEFGLAQLEWLEHRASTRGGAQHPAS